MNLTDQIENLIRQTGPMTMRSIRAHFPSPWRDGGVRNRKRIGDRHARRRQRRKFTLGVRMVLAIIICAGIAAAVAIHQNRRQREKRMLYYVIEVAHTLSNGDTYWGRDTDRNVFKAIDGRDACNYFARNVPASDRPTRRIRRIEADEFQEHGGIV
jgi:hypothetical protein